MRRLVFWLVVLAWTWLWLAPGCAPLVAPAQQHFPHGGTLVLTTGGLLHCAQITRIGATAPFLVRCHQGPPRVTEVWSSDIATVVLRRSP